MLYMGIPYEFIRVLEGKRPTYLDIGERLPAEQAQFLMQNENMKGKYLGACLDSCRWGSYTTVMYEMTINGMIGFIQNWMSQNQGNFQWHERKIDEMHTRFKLPHIDHNKCPRNNNHNETIMDLLGRVRCARKSEKRFKPSYLHSYEAFDMLAGTTRVEYLEDQPQNPLTDGDVWDEKTGELLSVDKEIYEKYLADKERFDEEERTEIVDDFCYAIISDRDVVLPLETVIKRLNLRPETIEVYCKSQEYSYPAECNKVDELSKEEKKMYELIGRCQGHIQPNNKIEFPFDGWDLAYYVQKWHEQFKNNSNPLFYE
jgi:hypothetical protein